MADWAGRAAEILAGVSRETRAKLEIYEAELHRWQTVKNLVGPSTLDGVWIRHFADSLQLANLADGEVWADLGSGAGFPGLVVAIARPGTRMHLVESDGRKCAFLRHVARATGASAQVWEGRIDAVLPRLEPTPQVVTARALAGLDELLRLASPLLTKGAIGLFPKGRGYLSELTKAAESWRFAADAIPSAVDPEGRILRIRRFDGPITNRPTDPT
ncbi:16S rRNA (guanine(527)-N(7))-methyltransferase RsmG [Enterovirga aerilata]|uniref:Ribosomal RNA small subunit methyltransferase G n=1 Tax=Enterovirga aerilata TaxID=2730920 RepID=A0A849IBR5_9HYPH|nr:16S rRNA (guanine(527)-N(7))-methyltransferase RsmG [Enterovirga sp. DB1703]NNM73695.1 16S rRNA (guanine(527)-N(7))-methyltransferase RsmG [Enterovirga sp. DB1703]